jgi:hypothetical protein
MSEDRRGAEARVVEVSIGRALAQSKNRLEILLELLGSADLPSAADICLRVEDPPDNPEEGGNGR